MALALLTGLATVVALVAIATVSVVEQFDELRAAVSQGVDDVAGRLQDEPFSSPRREPTASSPPRSRVARGVGLRRRRRADGAGIIAGLVLAVAMLYFVLRDGAALWAAILRRCSPDVRPALDRAGRRAWEVLGGFVRGTFLVATIDAVLIGIGLWLLDVPCVRTGRARLHGLVRPVRRGVRVRPRRGARRPRRRRLALALAVLALVVGVQFTEGTFLQPFIQSRSVDLHPR